MDWNTISDNAFAIIGIISSLSFIFIAISDFLVASMDIIVTKTLRRRKHIAAKRLVFLWSLTKDVYEEFRKFIDRLSAYSRPRKGEARDETKLR